MSVGASRELVGTGEIGAVYLLHIEPSYKHAGRYIGWVHVEAGQEPLEAVQQRFARHMSGKGSPLIRAAVQAGHAVVIARVWEQTDRHFERALKEGKNSSRLDPISQGQMTLEQALWRYHGVSMTEHDTTAAGTTGEKGARQ